MNGKLPFLKDEGGDAPVGSQANLRTVFCDGGEAHLVSPAQQAATAECQHPRQDRVRPDERFESHGLN